MKRASRWRYTYHNMIGHPMMHLFHLLGDNRRALMWHESTLPEEDRGRPVAQAVRAGEYFGKNP